MKRFPDPAQDASPDASERSGYSRSMGRSSAADRAIVLRSNTQKMPLRKRRSSTRGAPRGLFGSIDPDGSPLMIGEFIAHDLKFQVWELESGASCRLSPGGLKGLLSGRSGSGPGGKAR